MEKKWLQLAKRVLLATAILLVCLVALCAGVSALIQAEVLSVSAGKHLCAVLMEICVFAVCYLTAKKASHSRMPTAVAAAAVFLGLRLLLRQILDPAGEVSGMWQLALTMAAAITAGLLTGTKKQRRR